MSVNTRSRTSFAARPRRDLRWLAVVAVTAFVAADIGVFAEREQRAQAAPLCTTTWVGQATGLVALNAPASWSTGLAPTPSDVVCFASNVSIRVQSGALTVAGWDIAPGGAARLDNGAVVTTTGVTELGGVSSGGNSRLLIGADAYVESGETFAVPAGAGNIDPIVAGATLTVREGGQFLVDSIAISGVDIVNRGTLTVNGRFARVGMRPGTNLTNFGRAALNGPTTIDAEPGSPVPTARNEPGGIVAIEGPAFVPLRSGGIVDAAHFSGIAFINDGTMHVRSGQGALWSGGVHDGVFQIDAGAQPGISGSSNVFGPGWVVTGAGSVRVSVFSVSSNTTSVTVDAADTHSGSPTTFR